MGRNTVISIDVGDVLSFDAECSCSITADALSNPAFFNHRSRSESLRVFSLSAQLCTYVACITSLCNQQPSHCVPPTDPPSHDEHHSHKHNQRNNTYEGSSLDPNSHSFSPSTARNHTRAHRHTHTRTSEHIHACTHALPSNQCTHVPAVPAD